MLAVCESAPSLYVTEEGRKGTRETECCCDRKMDRFLGSIPVPLGSSPDYNFLQYTFQCIANTQFFAIHLYEMEMLSIHLTDVQKSSYYMNIFHVF